MWESLWPVAQLFLRVRTQWRTRGMEGDRYALDYNPAIAIMKRMNLTDAEWLEMIDDLRVLEDEAVATMRANHG